MRPACSIARARWANSASALVGPISESLGLAPAAAGLIVLLFDISSMQAEDVQRAVDSAAKYVNETMSPADMVAVATVSSMLDVLTDFTGDRARVGNALARLGYTEGTATAPPAGGSCSPTAAST